MAVKYVGGGGGLFSSFLPNLLQLGGAALGGPVGAAAGSALGSAINGGSVGDMVKSGIGGYLGQGGQIGKINAPNVDTASLWNNQAMASGTPFTGESIENYLNGKYNWPGGPFSAGRGW